MTIKEKIQKDFIVAMKAKDENAKAALSNIKAAITVAEKVSNTELSDNEVIKVLSKAIKQREESLKIYQDAGRIELAKKEADEACVLRTYMPKQMSESEIEKAAVEIIAKIKLRTTNPAALLGSSIGEFNKTYNGQADIVTVKTIITKLLNS